MAAQPEPDREPAFGLPVRDARILDFERRWWRHAGPKEEAIRAEFGLTAARYYQLLNAVIESPSALRHDPILVRRLQRARDTRATAIAQRVFMTSRPIHETND